MREEFYCAYRIFRQCLIWSSFRSKVRNAGDDETWITNPIIQKSNLFPFSQLKISTFTQRIFLLIHFPCNVFLSILEDPSSSNLTLGGPCLASKILFLNSFSSDFVRNSTTQVVFFDLCCKVLSLTEQETIRNYATK